MACTCLSARWGERRRRVTLAKEHYRNGTLN